VLDCLERQLHVSNTPQAQPLPSERLILSSLRVIYTNHTRARTQRRVKTLIRPIRPRPLMHQRGRSPLLIVMHGRRILYIRLTPILTLRMMIVRSPIPQIRMRRKEWWRLYVPWWLIHHRLRGCNDDSLNVP
jgi:hypothetical protein